MSLDRDTALERLGGDEAVYAKMALYLVRDYADLSERLSPLIAKRSRDAYILVHSLKNISASLGAYALSDRALQLERRLKRDEFENITDLAALLFQEFDRVMPRLRPFAEESSEDLQMGDLGESDLGALLDAFAEGLGSFSPERVNSATARVKGSWVSLIPEELKTGLKEVLNLADNYEYLEGEDKLNALRQKHSL